MLKVVRTNVGSSRVKNTQRQRERERERERPIRVMLHVVMQGTG
jgi:hypothetical protein